MGNIEISIFSADKDYAGALAGYIANAGVGFAVKLLATEKEAADEIQGKRHLVTDAVMEGRYIFLAESKDQGYGQEQEQAACKAVVYKYLPADILTEELAYQVWVISGKKRQGVRPSVQKTRVLSFCSGGGGAGNSVITMAAARALCAKGKKVLYLNLEDINASKIYTGGPAAPPRTTADYIYKVLSEKQAESVRGFTYTDMEGVRYFYEDEGQNALKVLSHEEMNRIVSHLFEEAAYDYVLADVTGSITPAVQSILDFTTDVLFISDRSPKSLYKNGQLRLLLSRREDEMRPFRIAQVYNRQGIYDDERQEHEEGVFHIAEEQEAFRDAGERTEILRHGEFGRGIEKIRRWIEKE